MKETRKMSYNIAEKVRKKIESSEDRIWRYSDFANMPFTAVAKTLSRLSKQGVIQRIGKGLYYRPRQTSFGLSKPNLAQLRSLPILRNNIFPAGNTAANLLGFTTQNPAKVEISTNGLSLPLLIVGKETIIHTRRPELWKSLSKREAALLDFIRNRGKNSELSSHETISKLLDFFNEPDLFEHLLHVAKSEPPRVRAILGAIGEEIGCAEQQLLRLRKSLNPLSRFDFGNLSSLKHAKQWQAKDSSYETI